MARMGDIKVKIGPEMTDEAKAILREMIVEELKSVLVFSDTVKPLEMLRKEMREMVKEEIEAYFHHSMNIIRTQVQVGNALTDKEMLDSDIARMQDPRYKNTR